MFLRVLLFFIFCLAVQPLFSQCLTPSAELVPDQNESFLNGYGSVLESFGDYLIVSESNNDQINYNGGIVYIYKLKTDNSWEQIATLSPETVNPNMYFGSHMAIGENTIVISGNTFTDIGLNYDRIYVFKKEAGEEWSSGTEDFSFELAENLPNGYGTGIRKMDFNEGRLAISYYNGPEAVVGVYEGENLSRIARITATQTDVNGSDGRFGSSVNLNDDFMAISASWFKNPDGGLGIVFIYDLNQLQAGPVAQLTPSLSIQDYGLELILEENVLFVSAPQDISETDYPAHVLVFEKTEGEPWVSGKETAILTYDPGFYTGRGSEIHMTGDYLFLSKTYTSNSQIIGFKKTGTTWQNSLPSFFINNPKSSSENKRHFGSGITTVQNHLLITHNEMIFHNQTPLPDEIMDFYLPAGDFENAVTPSNYIKNPYNSATDDLFGVTLFSHGNKMAVGSPGDDNTGMSAGMVYFYSESDGVWNLEQKIYAPNGKGFDNFGSSIFFDDNDMFIAAVFADSLKADGSYAYASIGKVYHFIRSQNQWVYNQTIISPYFASVEHFGRSISYSNGSLAVGQYYTGSSNSTGYVHLFENSGSVWEHKGTFRPSDDPKGDFFGKEVIINDSLLIVATGNPEYIPNRQNKVYIFKKENDEWQYNSESAFLLSSDKTRSDQFGFSISMNGDKIIVGAPNYRENNLPFAGRAYIFQMPEDGWNGHIAESKILKPEVLKPDFLFGYSVLATSNKFYVSAPHSLNYVSSRWLDFALRNFEPGRIFVFDALLVDKSPEKTISEIEILYAPTPRPLDAFGISMVEFENQLITGAPYATNTSGHWSGSVYVSISDPALSENEITVCKGTPPLLLSEGGSWTGPGINGDGLFDPELVEVGEFIITHESNQGCITSVLVSVKDAPELNIASLVTEICLDNQAELTLEGTTENIQWFSKDQGELTEYEDETKLPVSEPGIYFAQSVIDNCVAKSNEIEITTSKDKLFIPNVITPNMDSKNDQLRIQHEGIGEFTFYLYNRWGEEVFQIDDADFRWSPSEQTTPGIYYWQAEYKTCFGESKQEKGWIHVMAP